MVDLEKRQDMVKHFSIKGKIDRILADVIYLKTENRNIGAKIRAHYKTVADNSIKISEHYAETGEIHHCYDNRISRDLTTIKYLEKLQEYNSHLINSHRMKIKSLRLELEWYGYNDN